MAQKYIKFNNKVIRQPDEGLSYDWETTYTEGSGRVQSGKAKISSMFSVESFGYEATKLDMDEVSEILKIIAKGKTFKMYYFSPYYGEWRTDTFYVGQGSISLKSLKNNYELFESLSFNIIGVNPLS